MFKVSHKDTNVEPRRKVAAPMCVCRLFILKAPDPPAPPPPPPVFLHTATGHTPCRLVCLVSMPERCLGGPTSASLPHKHGGGVG